MQTPLPNSDSSSPPIPFAPFRLFLGILGVVLVMQGLILLQGFFIALAGLDNQQSMVMIKPVYIYVLPVYYYFSSWLGRTLPNKAFLLAVMLAIISFLLVSYINFLYLELPFAHSITDLYILVSYMAISVLGGAQGKKKVLGRI